MRDARKRARTIIEVIVGACWVIGTTLGAISLLYGSVFAASIIDGIDANSSVAPEVFSTARSALWWMYIAAGVLALGPLGIWLVRGRREEGWLVAGLVLGGLVAVPATIYAIRLVTLWP